MKKLFTLMVLMCLLGANRIWAADYIYFNECPQLDFGTTSFNCLSLPMFFSDSSTPIGDNDKKNNFSWYAEAYEGITITGGYTLESNGRYTLNEDQNLSFTGTGTIVITVEDEFGYITKNIWWGNPQVEFNNWNGNVQINSNSFANAEVGDIIRGYVTNASNYKVALKNGPNHGDWWGNFGGAAEDINPNTQNSSYFDYVITSDMINELKSYGCGFQGTGGFKLTSVDLVKKGKAGYIITVLEEGQKRHWDFTKHQLVVGPYNDKAWRLANDSQWEFKKYNPDNNNEDVYRYKGSINASNAGIVAELNGGNDKNLWVNEGDPSNKNLGKNKLSIRNEPTPPERVNEGIKYSLNRYIAVEPGVTLKITGLQKGDKVRMLLDKYGDDMELTFSNAQDVLGNNISGVYKVGGSSDTSEGKYSLGSYYNFIVAENGTFEMTQTKNTCYVLKIYDIEVYSSDFKQSNEILSYKKNLENSTKSINGYSLVNGYQCIANYDVSPAMQEQDLSLFDAFYYLHHRGKDETVCDYEIIKTSHNLNLTKNDFDLPWRSGGGGKYYKDRVSLKTETKNMIRNNQIFGSFILRIKLYDANQAYVTDYADRIISIGFIEKVNHPITWDFTDLKQYVEKADYLLKETDYADNNSHLDLSIWKKDDNDWRLDYNRYNPNGAPFAWGTQLYAGTKMFDETRGIGFAPINNNVSTSSLKITDDGLRIEDPQTNGGWEMSIHEIDGLAAVYIRYEPIEGKTPRIDCQYNRANDASTNKPIAHVIYNKDVDGTNDKIQGHSALIIWDAVEGGEVGSGCTNEFKIYLNNVILKKIGTSKDQKRISKPGYATESRLRDIDHSLTAYFTGLPIEAYTGYLPAEEDYSKVVLKRIDNDEDHKVLPASTDGVGQSNTGCILYNNVDIDATNGKSTVAGLDGGIHLFVPDMHDVNKKVNINNVNNDGSNHKNVLLSFKPTHNYFTFADQDKNDPENYIYMEDEGKLTFLLSAKKYAYGTNGESVTPGYDVYFVRVDPNAKRKISVPNGGTDQWGNPTYDIVTDDAHPGYAYLTRNCAYIRVPKDKVKELTSGGSTGNAKVSFIFEDELFGEINNGIATGIDQVTSNKSQVTSAEWYNLNGQKLNGMPTEKGLYIVNGRKVLVK